MENKNKVIEESVEIIGTLLESGNDEDAHFWGYTQRTISGPEILKLIQDIDSVDVVMSQLRPVIVNWLKGTAEDYIKNDPAVR